MPMLSPQVALSYRLPHPPITLHGWGHLGMGGPWDPTGGGHGRHLPGCVWWALAWVCVGENGQV